MESEKINNEAIESIEETALRLHVYLKRLVNESGREWNIISEKIENGKSSLFKKEDKVKLSELMEYQYYLGKMMAYIVALRAAGHPDIPETIERLRGLEYNLETNHATQTKHVKSLENVGP